MSSADIAKKYSKAVVAVVKKGKMAATSAELRGDKTRAWREAIAAQKELRYIHKEIVHVMKAMRQGFREDIQNQKENLHIPWYVLVPALMLGARPSPHRMRGQIERDGKSLAMADLQHFEKVKLDISKALLQFDRIKKKVK